MRAPKTTMRWLLTAIAAAQLVACGTTTRAQTGTDTASRDQVEAAAPSDDILRLKTYQSLDDLVSDSIGVAIVTPSARATVSAMPDTDEDFPYVVHNTPLKVRDLVLGELPNEISLHETVQKGFRSRSGIVEGHDYLVFLIPFYYEKGKPTGEYALIDSPVGVYEMQQGGQAAVRVMKVDGDTLPDSIEVESLRSDRYRAAVGTTCCL